MEGPNASGLSATHPQPSNAFDATSHISSHVHVLTHPRSMHLQPSSPWRWPQSYMYICVCPLSHCLPPSLVVKLPAQLTPSTKWRPGTITSFAPAAATPSEAWSPLLESGGLPRHKRHDTTQDSANSPIHSRSSSTAASQLTSLPPLGAGRL